MPRTPANLPRHELIGLHVAIVDATDQSRNGMEGRVVDETQHTLVIETARGEKTVPKRGTVFRFDLADIKVRVHGQLLTGRPEDRLSKKLPRKWGRTPNNA